MARKKMPPFAALKEACADQTAPFAVKVPYPPRVIWPNGRAHWSVKAGAVKTARTSAGLIALEALCGNPPPKWHRVRVSCVWWVASSRGGAMSADRDNRIAALKASIDGLCDAGIIENDRGVEWGAVETGGVDEADPGVVLMIEPLPEVSCRDCAALPGRPHMASCPRNKP